MRCYTVARFLLFFVFSFAQINASINASSTDYFAEYFTGNKKVSSVAELQGGLSGAKNYKATSDGRNYVLRILNPKESLYARKHEIAAATFAGERGIGPKILYVAPLHEAMIMEFVEGQTLTPSLLEEKAKLCALLQTIKKLHSSTGDFPNSCTIFEKIRQQLKQLEQSRIPLPLEEVLAAQEKLRCIEEQFKLEPIVPCHNDLSALNIIADGDVFKFIDWTDSSMGHAYNDLGYFVLVNQIPDERYNEALCFYLERTPSDQEIERLKLMKKVNKLRIFASNFPAYEPPVEDESSREKRQLELEEKLQSQELQPLQYFFDLHAKGKLSGKEDVIALSLSALREFLNE
jgi:thiamine kinase-like enzyme